MLVQTMLSTVRKYDMLRPGDRALVAVSGGPDSMALLHALFRSRDELSIEICAFHLDHMFRGAESAEDAEAVRSYCSELGIPVVVERYDVPAFAEESGLSPQDAARVIRYELACLAAASRQCTCMAFAHHRDDNFETIVMRFLRGAGLRGLTGIRPVRTYSRGSWTGRLVRPLIECTRQDIELYCTEEHIPTRTDRSNLSDKYARNKVRLDLIPHLLTYNPNLAQTATSASRFMADEDDFLEEQAGEFLARHSGQRGDILEVDIEALANAHPALFRRTVLLAIERVRGTRKDMYSMHVEDVMELVRTRGRSGMLSLPDGLQVRKRYGVLEFGWSGALQPARIAPYMKPLRVPGLTVIPHSSKMIIADVVPVEQLDREFKSTDPSVAHMDYDVVSGGLAVRNRRDGDRFKPLGMAGTKKLKEFFIDSKIRAELRDQIPLVVYGDDGTRIAWIGELRLSDDVKITEKTRRVLRLHVEPIEE